MPNTAQLFKKATYITCNSMLFCSMYVAFMNRYILFIAWGAEKAGSLYPSPAPAFVHGIIDILIKILVAAIEAHGFEQADSDIAFVGRFAHF